MTAYTDAREAWNRAAFDPATPELQLVPAEEMQLPLAGATVPYWIYPVAMLLGFAGVAVLVAAT